MYTFVMNFTKLKFYSHVLTLYKCIILFINDVAEDNGRRCKMQNFLCIVFLFIQLCYFIYCIIMLCLKRPCLVVQKIYFFKKK